MAIKLINSANGQFIDDINNPLEAVYCVARHPKAEMIAYGGALGTPRIYRISDNQQRTAGRNDTNLVRAFERQAGPVHAVAFSPDGAFLAVGGATGEGKIFRTDNGAVAATLQGSEGSIFAVAFHPQGAQVATGGFDGKVRIFNAADGALAKEFAPVPLLTEEKMMQALGDITSSGAGEKSGPKLGKDEFLKVLRE
ncbi:hypothetical protein HYR69_07175 [Candidatus Sumerlaeota bacterium]|nr:hypothetical protein [Candidatus Sumerlaeota bacterium]